MKKRLSLFLVSLLLLGFLPCAALANSPVYVPDDVMRVSLYNSPEEAVYFDILVPLSEEDASYTTCNSLITEVYGLATNCDMVTLSLDGYRSSSAHLKGMPAFALIDQENRVECDERTTALLADAADGRMRAALFDITGTLICCSEPLSINAVAIPRYSALYGLYYYDAATGTFEQFALDGYLTATVVAILLLLSALLTAAIEGALASKLGLHPAKRAVILNLCSNSLMNAVLFVLLIKTMLPVWLLVTGLEAIACWCEYSICRNRLYSQVPRNRLLLFILVGNFASLAAGLLLHAIF